MEKPKRKKPVHVSSKTLKFLRDQGFIAQVVEQTIPRLWIKRDFIGAIDIIAFHPEKEITMGVQVTTTSNAAARVKKILLEPRVRDWLRAGNVMMVHGWSKKGKAGKRKLWTLVERKIFLSDFEDANTSEFEGGEKI